MARTNSSADVQNSARSHAKHFGIPVGAEYLGISERHLRRLIQERRIPHFKIGSRVILSSDDCESFLEKARREALR